ncbi:MAG: cytochrome c peroxidase [Longimicrobiales bacterium]|nr:cytochrome c peroxidase [Longimicrobiales bacterium]
MRMQTTPLLVLLAVTTVAACSDLSTSIAPEDALHAKGGEKGKPGDGGDTGPVASMAALGEALFFAEALSLNGNQACSTCHEPTEGFAAPLSTVTTEGSVVEGSVPGAFGDRKPPTAAYATLTPIFDGSGKGASGGTFWDGRATGLILGNPAADQALGPFLNPAEQAMPDEACVILRITESETLLSLWRPVWGTDIETVKFPGDVETTCTTLVTEPGVYVALTDADRATVEAAYDQVALSIAEFEATLNTFSSRFDAGQLTATEADGEQLFSSKGKCHQCHEVKGDQPLFTDFAFHNLGVPRNPDHPVYPFGVTAFDPGLGGFTGEAADAGKFKTPTVRNVAVGSNRTYMHNGSLVTLEQVVQFYNTRDVLRTCEGAELSDPSLWGPSPGIGCWPPPEHPENLDTKNMGNLGLTVEEVDAIVAFMRALSDQ